MQNCQQKRSRDNLVENNPTNVEDDKFTLRDQMTQGTCFLGLIDESLSLILQICDLASGHGSVELKFSDHLKNQMVAKFQH